MRGWKLQLAELPRDAGSGRRPPLLRCFSATLPEFQVSSAASEIQDPEHLPVTARSDSPALTAKTITSSRDDRKRVQLRYAQSVWFAV
jgi:hypothetical protein